MNKVYLVVYHGEIYGSYYKAGDIRYHIFSSKRKARKFINRKVSHLKKATRYGYDFDDREKERSKYLIFRKEIDKDE